MPIHESPGDESAYRVLVIGGYGFFGRRLIGRLLRQQNVHVVIAGRDADQAHALAHSFGEAHAERLSVALLDIHSATLVQDLQRFSLQALIHTAGPFQTQDYRVAKACIATRIHYIDLADGRSFVTGITALNDSAKRSDVLITSGASSVPALSSAAVDELTHGWPEIQAIDIGISPGNRTERGLSTVQAILSYCGKPLLDSQETHSFGWAGAWRHEYPHPVGSRLLSPCDVPDVFLLPKRYPGSPRVRFGAGLELDLLHRSMNLMAWCTRKGLVRDWAVHAKWLKHLADLFKRFGSEAGAMHVSVEGLLPSGKPARRAWHLLATDGDGPCVPILAAAALVRKLRENTLAWRGAAPCIGMLTLADFHEEAEGLNICMGETAS